MSSSRAINQFPYCPGFLRNGVQVRVSILLDIVPHDVLQLDLLPSTNAGAYPLGITPPERCITRGEGYSRDASAESVAHARGQSQEDQKQEEWNEEEKAEKDQDIHGGNVLCLELMHVQR